MLSDVGVQTNCQDILTLGHSRGNGLYWLDPDAGSHSNAFLAYCDWNRPNLVLQTLGNLAIRLQALNRKLNVPRTFGHFRSDQAHAQAKGQSAKSFLAL